MTNTMDLHINVWEEHFNKMKSSSPWTWDNLLSSSSIVQLHQVHGVQSGQSDFYRMAMLWERRRSWYLLWDSPPSTFLLGSQNHIQMINLLKNQSLYPCSYLKATGVTANQISGPQTCRKVSFTQRKELLINYSTALYHKWVGDILKLWTTSWSHSGKNRAGKAEGLLCHVTHRCPLSLVGEAGTAYVVALWWHFWLLENA